MLTDSERAEVAEIAARTAIEYFKKEIENEYNEKFKENIKKTKSALKSYRLNKRATEMDISYDPEVLMELRHQQWKDLMEGTQKAESIIRSEDIRLQERFATLNRIDNAFSLYKSEVEKYGYEEDKRAYRVVYDMYIGEEPTSVESLAEKENITDRQVYRDLNNAIRILTVYLCGTPAI